MAGKGFNRTLLKPLLPVALAVTLILTGLSCAILSMSIVKDATERGIVVLIAVAFSVFEPWVGMLVGIAIILVVIGPNVFVPSRSVDPIGSELAAEESD